MNKWKFLSKNILSYFFTIFVIIGVAVCFTGCDNSTKKITSYYLNEDGELVSVLDSGDEVSLGNWGDEIIASLNEVKISDDGHYIINGIKTSISLGNSFVKGVSSVTISNDGYYVVNNVKTQIKLDISFLNGISSITVSNDGFYVINGVKTNIVATNIYTVRFNTGYNVQISNQRIKEGHRVEKPVLERTGYDLVGWYYNDEKWVFNSDTVLNDMTLTAKWSAHEHTIHFIDGMDGRLIPSMDMTVTYGTKVGFSRLFREGYEFKGWYYGDTLVGNEEWLIDSDATLVCRWSPMEFGVMLDPAGGTVSSSIVYVKYNENYVLPIPTNDYGVFIGWFVGNTQMTDSNGNSLAPWTYLQNLKFTTTWTIHINSIDDLENLYLYPNANFELEKDLELGGNEWTPIGTDSTPFSGNFNGNDHTINHLTITSCVKGVDDYSFFGVASAAKIKNLKMLNVNISLDTIESVYVSAIVSRDIAAEATYFANISTSGVIEIRPTGALGISNTPIVGGICAYAPAMNAENCVNEINLEGGYFSGGIYGVSEFGRIKANNLTNHGEIECYYIAGGIVGSTTNSSVTLNSAYNTGDVCAVKNAGGLIGWARLGAVIQYSYNTGYINATDTVDSAMAGGLVGIHGGTLRVIDCYNQGRVDGRNAGGIIGGQNINCSDLDELDIKTVILNVYNSGNIYGSRYVGGIVGLSNYSITISYSCNLGTISGDSVKETFGYINIGDISHCYYTVAVNNSTQGTSITLEELTDSFYTQTLSWSSNVWLFSGTKPTFKSSPNIKSA